MPGNKLAPNDIADDEKIFSSLDKNFLKFLPMFDFELGTRDYENILSFHSVDIDKNDLNFNFMNLGIEEEQLNK